MKKLFLVFALSTYTASLFANALPCALDSYSSKRIKEISSKRDITVDLTNSKGEVVGALFLGKAKKPIDMIICGTRINYFYVRGDLRSWAPEAYEYKQFATVDSATIYQDEAIVSAVSYTEEEDIDKEEIEIQVFMQYISLADFYSESADFFISVPQ